MANSLWKRFKDAFSSDNQPIQTNDVHSTANKSRTQEEEKCDFTQILSPDNIFIEEDLQSRNEVLKRLSQVVSMEDQDKIYGAFLLREKQSSTNLGEGIALPHVQSKQVLKLTMVILRLENPIDWGDEKVNLVFGLLIPKPESNFEHVKFMASLSKKLLKPSFVYALKEATTAEQIINLLTQS
jgi:mannitol/fructose-specific phosphotransferase system IIA component (Ntr-type)